MSIFRKDKSAANRYREADASTQKLRNKRSKLDPATDGKKIKKINSKIHKNNVEKYIADKEMGNPKVEINNKTNNFNVNNNRTKNSKEIHVHAHKHIRKK